MLCILFFKQKAAYEMRISDWSSDVCSSDLFGAEVADQALDRPGGRVAQRADRVALDLLGDLEQRIDLARLGVAGTQPFHHAPHPAGAFATRGDRKSVVQGKSVSVRVDLGGSRFIKTKKRNAGMT